MYQTDRNRDCAERAYHAIQAHQRNMGQENEDDHTAVTDLLTDLMHFCDGADADFSTALFQAEGHYDAETNGED